MGKIKAFGRKAGWGELVWLGVTAAAMYGVFMLSMDFLVGSGVSDAFKIKAMMFMGSALALAVLTGIAATYVSLRLTGNLKVKPGAHFWTVKPYQVWD